MTNQDEYRDEYRKELHSIDADNTAHYMFHEIKKLKDKLGSGKVHMRWIWELLQNAYDARKFEDNTLIAAIEYSREKGKLVFLHNGRGFEKNEIAHLIKSGTSKDERDEETQGKFGRGFLTTHLLSSKVKVSGPLKSGSLWFNFTLERNDESKPTLAKSLKQSEEKFISSICSIKPPSIPNSFTTRFMFPIKEQTEEAVMEGIQTLEQWAPYVIVFNKEFSEIKIKKSDGVKFFKSIDDPTLISSEIQQIAVVEGKDDTNIVYLLAQSDQKTSVAVPMKSIGDSSVCMLIENIPKLFSDFPLVGTDTFNFPAVINNPNFSSGPDRDVVPLDGNEKSNIKNQEVIREACTLLVSLIEFAASKRWNCVHEWILIPFANHLAIQTELELKKSIKNLIKEICQKPVIVTELGQTKTLKEAYLPLVENDNVDDVVVKKLWSLLNDLQEYCEKLPRRDEAAGWRKVIKSWAKVHKCEVSNLHDVGVIDGRKLASYIRDKCSNLKDLQNLLQENVCAVDWLNRLYEFLKDNRLFDDKIRNLHIFPNQVGELKPLRPLHLDRNIDKELKEVDRFLGSTIQNKLRDTELTSLENEKDSENWDNKHIVKKLISALQGGVNNSNNPDDNFKAASAHLFAWIVHQDQKDYWECLQDVPVFTEDDKSHRSLRSAFPNNMPLLAPVSAWPEGLQKFKDLFPSNRILADDFFKEVDDLEAWKQLDKQDFIRRDMIIQTEGTDLKLLSSEVYGDNKDHETAEPVHLTDFIERAAVMHQVRDSRHLGCLFWQFLTEWLVKEDSQGIETKLAKCESCEKYHRYYPAAWMIPVLNNQWIRQKGRVSPNAKSLANLLRNSKWEPNSLNENPAALKLLEEMDVSLSDLNLGLLAENEEKRNAVINLATTLHDVNPNDLRQVNELVQHAAEGNLSQINAVAQDLKEDEDLFEELEKRRRRRDMVHENQRIGQQVEELVDENLTRAGFKVEVTGKGSDFKILPDWEDTEDITTLEIRNSDDQSWLIEVKSTRYKGVHMSFKQAETAKEKRKKFLLCVVPIGQEEVTPEIVRENMRFIQDIGNSVARLCEDLNSLEELREEIIADGPAGVKLVCKAGTAGIHVNHTVWENEGFPLDKLTENLK